MRIDTSTAVLHPGVLRGQAPSPEAIPGILKAAGFDGLDWSLWAFCLKDGAWGFMNDPEWEKTIATLAEADEAAGMPCGQTHSISVNYSQYEAMDRAQLRRLEKRCLSASARLGAKWMVIHPFAPPGLEGEAAMAFFSAYLAPLQELAHGLGVGIAVENMIRRPGTTYRFCAEAEELRALLDGLNDPRVGCCWDTGHGNISGQNPYEALTLLGGRTQALHINDNMATELDLHLLPYEGNVDWEGVLRGLRQAGYAGAFTFEHALHPLPAQAVFQQLGYMCSLGRAMLASGT